MRLPEKTELPLNASPQTIFFDETLRSKFCKAFKSDRADMPPTTGAVALTGVFQILNSLNVDWKGLLHATQRFVYHQEIKPGTRVQALTKLKDARVRAGMAWLQFETNLVDEVTRQPYVDSFSLIMVKVNL